MCMYYVVNRLSALYRPVGRLLGPIWVKCIVYSMYYVSELCGSFLYMSAVLGSRW